MKVTPCHSWEVGSLTGADLGTLKGGADTVQGCRKQFCIGTGTVEGSA